MKLLLNNAEMGKVIQEYLDNHNLKQTLISIENLNDNKYELITEVTFKEQTRTIKWLTNRK